MKENLKKLLPYLVVLLTAVGGGEAIDAYTAAPQTMEEADITFPQIEGAPKPYLIRRVEFVISVKDTVRAAGLPTYYTKDLMLLARTVKAPGKPTDEELIKAFERSVGFRGAEIERVFYVSEPLNEF